MVGPSGRRRLRTSMWPPTVTTPGRALPAEPNAAGTDGPLASLASARDAIRKMKKAGPLPDGGVTVWLRGGCYRLPRRSSSAPRTPARPRRPSSIAPIDGEKPVVMGCKPVTGFVPYQGKILKADVAAQGLQGVYFRQLFFDGQRQHLARYPNYDPNNPYGGGWAYADGKSVPMYGDIPGEDRRTLQYKAAGRPALGPARGRTGLRLPALQLVEQHRADRLDRPREAHHHAGRQCLVSRSGPATAITSRTCWRNSTHRANGISTGRLDALFLAARGPLEGNHRLRAHVRTIVEIGPGTAHVTLRGLTIEGCEGTAVVLNDTDDCLIAGSTIRNVGDYDGSGVAVNGGTHNGVVGNDISETGSHGISI